MNRVAETTGRRFFRITAYIWVLLFFVGWAGPTPPALAYEGKVEKQVIEIPSYTTVEGRTIKMLKMGYETYGKLNPKGTNAILIPPFFGGNSHSAGKYREDDRFPGYWDSIIGSGKPLDTDRFFVISFDGLSNPNTKDGATVSAGPASVDPDTGKPYGMTFPTLTIRDFVNVQKVLVNSLGVKKVYMVMGASMGAMQAFEWAAAFPDMVERIIPVVGDAECDAFTIGVLESWMAPIKADPHWNNGSYYGAEEPMQGVKTAMKIVLMETRQSEWANKSFGRKWASPDKDPAKSMENLFAVQKFVEDAASERAEKYDANSLLYQVRAIQLFSVGEAVSPAVGLKQIKAKVLLLPGENDILFPSARAGELRDILAKQGNQASIFVLEGPLGHMNGILGISQASEAISKFLAN